MSSSWELPNMFEESEMLAQSLYDLRPHIVIAEYNEDVRSLLCTNCQCLMITVYRIFCGHLMCGPCVKKLVLGNTPWDEVCPHPDCDAVLNRIRTVQHGDGEEKIKTIVLERTYIKCPWNCPSDILIKNIFNHQLTCSNENKISVPPGIKTEKTFITSKELNELQEKCTEKFRKLEGDIVAVRRNNNDLESELRELTGKLARMNALFGRYSTMCTNLVGSQEWRSMNMADRDSIDLLLSNSSSYHASSSSRVVLGQSTWLVDLALLTMFADESPLSFFEQPTQIDRHEFRTHELGPVFEVGLTVQTRSGGFPVGSSGSSVDQLLVSCVSLVPTDDDEFYPWPLKATAILRVMDGEHRVAVERKVDFVVDIQSVSAESESSRSFNFPPMSLKDLATCTSFLTSNCVTMKIVVLKNGSDELGSIV